MYADSPCHPVKPALGAALKVAMDLQLFHEWHTAGDGEKTLAEIQELVPKIETKLLCESPRS